jgi:hydrogenase-4 component B
MGFSLVFVIVAALVQGAAAILSLVWRRDEPRARAASAIAGGVASLFGIAAALPVLSGGTGATASWPLALRFDPLSAFMVLAISLLSGATALYGFQYVKEYAGRGIGTLGFLMGIFVASMLLCVAADNVLLFLVCFEVMSLSACYLIRFEQDRMAIEAGRLYFAIAYTGSVLVVIAFALLFARTGGLSFESIRTASVPQPQASVVFLLAFLGFGAKVGMMPFHAWLPREAGAAPAHVSALLSGLLVKVGVFGIVKVGVDLLHANTLWWGLLVLAFGAVSAVLGVMYALAERDIKRLLAYSTAENVGIILMGLGIGMVGIATGQPLLAALGLLAGLYHMMNHAMFKGLLFLGAGAVVARLETKDMNQMGGLARTMPWTAAAFLIGALAISAMPPLNGFVSEWFTYQALFNAALHGGLVVRVAAPVAMVMLGITGALAAMCFVKVFGITFSGTPRGERAKTAVEVDRPMLGGMGVLAGCCVLFGLGAPLIAPLARNAAASLGGAGPAVTRGLTVFPGDPAQAVLSPALIGILLVGLLGAPVAIAGYFAALRPPRRIAKETWAAGYAPDASMEVSAVGFVEPIRVMFRPAFTLRSQAAGVSAWAKKALAGLISRTARSEPGGDRPAIVSSPRGVEAAGEHLQVTEGAGFERYFADIIASFVLLILFAALVALLAAGGR